MIRKFLVKSLVKLSSWLHRASRWCYRLAWQWSHNPETFARQDRYEPLDENRYERP